MPDASPAGSSFADVASEWLKKAEAKSHSEKEKYNTRRRLELHVFPFVGDLDIAKVDAAEILSVLQRLESRNTTATAKKVRQIISQIFRYGVATRKCVTDPTFILRDALAPYRPKHFPSITNPDQVGELMRAVDVYPNSVVRMAMQFSALVFLRPGEVRHTAWDEFDWGKNELRIPGERMKMKRPHIVPLSRQTLALLDALKKLTGHGQYLFPSNRAPKGDRPMSDSTILVALRSMGYSKEQMTAHGFRSMASTLLNENGFNRDWIERQLAHVEGNSVRAAYNYAEYLPERREMMQWWADYLDNLRKK